MTFARINRLERKIRKDDPYSDRKKYHMVDKVNPRGDISALCFRKPHPIDLKIALWTIRKEAVTCEACLQKLKRRLPG
jgi:hypothetical protein